jgi:hypothetical protein
MSILVLTSDTLIGTPATGNLEYNGQFYGTDSNASRAQMQRITQGTAVASTSGTSIDFTGLPAWVKRITVMLSGVSLSGTANPLVQIGAGSVTSSGYISSSAAVAGAGSTGMVTSTAGFILNSSGAANTNSGHMIITSVSSTVWVSSHSAKYSTTFCMFGGGDVTLSGTLDRVRITTSNGTDTFDAGSINIIYEG